jgi:DNA-3-methyladenine glycosylase I
VSARSEQRCAWAGEDPLMVAYHDTEWGVPQHDERRLFEMLTLEGAQAGLSWTTILRKRDGYRRAFAGFDYDAVAAFGDADVERLLGDSSIVRNRLKIASTIENARAVVDVRRSEGSLDAFLWRLAGGAPMVERRRTLADLPAETPLSRTISKELKRAGFRFVGPTVVYAFMQACGFVNDHVMECFRWRECQDAPP